MPNGQTLLTPHYALHTDVADAEFRRELARTMETAHAQYEAFTGVAAGPAGQRLDGYVFATRDEWADHTRRTAGPLADVYLLINRGGFEREKSFVTFFFGITQTLAACRHEGFHQYVESTFARRPPPFLEEGLATLFEEGFEDEDVNRPIRGGRRHLQLAAAVRNGRARPLGELLTMNAGDVADTDAPRIEAFYAQAWALAHFLAADARYRDGLRPLLRAYAAGETGDDPSLFASSFGVTASTLADDFAAYQRQLAGLD